MQINIFQPHKRIFIYIITYVYPHTQYTKFWVCVCVNTTRAYLSLYLLVHPSFHHLSLPHSSLHPTTIPLDSNHAFPELFEDSSTRNRHKGGTTNAARNPMRCNATQWTHTKAHLFSTPAHKCAIIHAGPHAVVQSHCVRRWVEAREPFGVFRTIQHNFDLWDCVPTCYMV